MIDKIKAERKVELEKQKIKESNRLDFHKFVLKKLESSHSQDIIKLANTRISLWKDNCLCSSYYIDHWSFLINSDLVNFKLEIIENKNNRASALMQNSPFSFLLKDFEQVNQIHSASNTA